VLTSKNDIFIFHCGTLLLFFCIKNMDRYKTLRKTKVIVASTVGLSFTSLQFALSIASFAVELPVNPSGSFLAYVSCSLLASMIFSGCYITSLYLKSHSLHLFRIRQIAYPLFVFLSMVAVVMGGLTYVTMTGERFSCYAFLTALIFLFACEAITNTMLVTWKWVHPDVRMKQYRPMVSQLSPAEMRLLSTGVPVTTANNEYDSRRR